MRTLSPHKRGPHAWKIWLGCALALQRRCPWQGSLLGCGVLCAAWALLQSNSALLPFLVILTGAPVIVALFTMLAARADGRSLGLPADVAEAWGTVCRLMALGILSWLLLLSLFGVGVAVVKLLASFAAFDEIAAHTTSSRADVIHGFSWHLAVAASLFVVAPMLVYLSRGFWLALAGWFLVPLLLDGRLSLLESYVLARRAEEANSAAVIRVRMLCIVLAGSVALSGGLLGLIVLPLIGALQYVSYRDVFLDQPANAKPEFAVPPIRIHSPVRLSE